MADAVMRAPPSDRRIVVPAPALADVAAERIAQAIERALARSQRAHVALAGGTTPRAIYRRLAQAPRLQWARVEIYFGDERAVAPDDPQSNYRMARETLLAAAPIVPTQIHRMPAERADLDAAANEYAAQLAEPLDLIILGIGADGHTASLFPGAPALRERRRKVVAVDGPKPPHRRLTVTPNVIAAAREKIVIAAGAEKSTAVARALALGDDDIEVCPARLARDGIWIIDEAAAAGLAGDSSPDDGHPPAGRRG